MHNRAGQLEVALAVTEDELAVPVLMPINGRARRTIAARVNSQATCFHAIRRIGRTMPINNLQDELRLAPLGCAMVTK